VAVMGVGFGRVADTTGTRTTRLLFFITMGKVQLIGQKYQHI